LYTSPVKAPFAFASALWRRGWEVVVGAKAEVLGEIPFALLRGDEETVVTVVVAVRGRSPEELDAFPADAGGIRPVTSNRRILDFKSSNSSHTEDAAVVEAVDTESADLAPAPMPATGAVKSRLGPFSSI
jgi:hypothetical protein